MAAKVLDSYALMAFFEDEPGADLVRSLILKAEEGSTTLLMSVVNLGEIWYAIARTNSEDLADRYVGDIQGIAIEIVEVNWQLTRQAAAFKAHGNISYADCFAAALAKERKAELITGDKEFKALQHEIKISWI
jgi:ribonuclease VapC